MATGRRVRFLARRSRIHLLSGKELAMNANRLQARRIHRCYEFLARRRPAIVIELVARTWIMRFAEQWRGRHGNG